MVVKDSEKDQLKYVPVEGYWDETLLPSKLADWDFDN
jgi:hypothetical protein